MGKIRQPPRGVDHGNGLTGTLVAEEKDLEEFENADYVRVLELVRWDYGDEELRSTACRRSASSVLMRPHLDFSLRRRDSSSTNHEVELRFPNA